jgi:hypothetical protein
MGDALRRRARVRGRYGSWLLLFLVPSACRSGGDAPTAREPSNDSEEQRLILPACGKDQVREYRCDALLPLHSALPAPEPYGACPGMIDVVAPIFVPLSRTAAFDAVHTEFMRRRAPPGHQCCYSWCASHPEAAATSRSPFPRSSACPSPRGASRPSAPKRRSIAARRPLGRPRALSFRCRTRRFYTPGSPTSDAVSAFPSVATLGAPLLRRAPGSSDTVEAPLGGETAC